MLQFPPTFKFFVMFKYLFLLSVASFTSFTGFTVSFSVSTAAANPVPRAVAVDTADLATGFQQRRNFDPSACGTLCTGCTGCILDNNGDGCGAANTVTANAPKDCGPGRCGGSECVIASPPPTDVPTDIPTTGVPTIEPAAGKKGKKKKGKKHGKKHGKKGKKGKKGPKSGGADQSDEALGRAGISAAGVSVGLVAMVSVAAAYLVVSGATPGVAATAPAAAAGLVPMSEASGLLTAVLADGPEFETGVTGQPLSALCV